MSEPIEVASNQELDLAHLPRLESTEWTPVSRRYLTMRLGVWTLLQLAIAALLLSPYIVYRIRDNGDMAEFSAWWWPMIGQGLVALVWLMEELLGFPRRGYAVRERDITYRSGWLTRTTITVPFGQIQHSELSQGPIGRLFRLKHIRLFTAGGSGNLRIAGVAEEEAEGLRAIIDARSGKA